MAQAMVDESYDSKDAVKVLERRFAYEGINSLYDRLETLEGSSLKRSDDTSFISKGSSSAHLQTPYQVNVQQLLEDHTNLKREHNDLKSEFA